jgi:hypothetical protein
VFIGKYGNPIKKKPENPFDVNAMQGTNVVLKKGVIFFIAQNIHIE